MLDKPDHSGGQAGARSPLDALRLRLYRGPGWRWTVRSGLARVWSWRKVAALALAALGLLWFVIIPGVLGPVVQGEAVVRADFVQSVVASGHVEHLSASTSEARSSGSSRMFPWPRAKR